MKSQSETAGKEMVLPVRYHGKPMYDIHIGADFSCLPEAVKALAGAPRRICVVTDTHVGPLYAEEISALLRDIAEVSVYTLPAGEEHKLLSEVSGIYEHLIQRSFERGDLLVALGGGVVGDMTGFAAATYLRGIRFVQVPTTLLSQTDSSIGGKTGVDFGKYKNMVGAFHMPSLVAVNVRTLDTLPDLQLSSGMGEVLKHGLILDEAYYEYVLDHMSEIQDRDPDVLRQVVEGSCRIKRSVVEKDPEEKGIRALLNFGHTLGHAIEKEKNYALPHGHCVALGCIAAAWISWKKQMIDEDAFYEIRDMMVGFGLPISLDGVSADNVIRAASQDKKRAQGRQRYILLDRIGHAVISDEVTEEEMRRALEVLLV